MCEVFSDNLVVNMKMTWLFSGIRSSCCIKVHQEANFSINFVFISGVNIIKPIALNVHTVFLEVRICTCNYLILLRLILTMHRFASLVLHE
jgi:hypothetical protein